MRKCGGCGLNQYCVSYYYTSSCIQRNAEPDVLSITL